MDKTKHLLFNGAYCGEAFMELLAKQSIPISAAQETLETAMFEGMAAQPEWQVQALSVRPMRSFPGNKQLFFGSKDLKLADNVHVHQLGFINLLLVKQFYQFGATFYATAKWLVKTRKQERYFYSYAINPAMLYAQLPLLKLAKVPMSVLVTELPQLRMYVGQNSFLRKNLLKVLTKSMVSLHKPFDKYIIMTKLMDDKINPTHKPSLVCEGMIQIQTHSEPRVSEEPYLLYTGTLERKYGILTLVEAFLALKHPTLKLLICGNGNTQDELKALASQHDNVSFLGMVSKEKARMLQKEAYLLVNPRRNEEFAKYSFPSKTFEYLLSGVPFVGAHLDGIPPEYDRFINYIEVDSVEAMQQGLAEVLSQDYNALQEKSLAAQGFVICEKNNLVQTKAILDFIAQP